MSNFRRLPRHATTSGWNALLPPRAPHAQPPRENRFHAIVVGAGYTGLAAARRLAELMPNREILVIEALQIGEGLSARNSGYLLVYPSAPKANAYGSADDDAIRKVSIATAGLNWLRMLVTDYKIDCDWDEEAPRITAAATREGERAAREAATSFKKWNMDSLEYDAKEIAGLIGTEYYKYAYQLNARVLVQPAALIRGLAETLPSNVLILEKTAVEDIESSGPFRVSTTRGTFVADRVFVANNTHAGAFRPSLNRMIPVFTYGALTPPLDEEELGRLGKAPSWGVVPAHGMGTTMRKVLGRLLIRSSWSYANETNVDKVRSLLTSLFRRRFPGMRSYEFEHVWGGATAITHNGEFYFGEIRPGLYASVGCNGAGVLRGTIHGKLLAEMACGSQSPLLTERLSLAGPSWIPPEPLRGIGAVAKMAWLDWRAGDER
ncbi:FAD-dependent oxidoreductase [Bradyrhizobium genosp. SA-3]|uniref:NAD(P)/FAD-dependent oxidoreductase n=1 Tax=Bradyrhizobium genosp. SA-3 TaxID=508868 RepID=UPI001028920A|nr:FAD-binding oxidoreductase [Bradyrhizobium genosp. SA-3]RZN06025.1 FAD-dependent oxidoreductase [Bradyrhizobium genosp. SA-3]